MKKFKDLSIRNKLFFSFFVVILFIFAIGIMGIINTKIINSNYSSLINTAEKRIIIINEIREKFTDTRRASESMIVYKAVLQKDFDYNLQYGFISENIDEITKKTEEYKNTFNDDLQIDNTTKENQLSMLNNINQNLIEFSSITNNLNSAVLNKNNDKITEEANNLTVKAGLIASQLDYLNILDEQTAENILKQNENSSNTSAIITAIVALIVIIFSILFATITSKSIVNPLKILTENTARIAKGDFTAQIGLNRADEVGLVSKSILQIKDTVKDLIKNINILSDEFAKGNMKSEIPANNYEGSYKETAEGINNIISTISNDFVTVSNCIKSYSDGNFKTVCPDMPGDKKECKESFDILMNNILNVNNEINNISYSIASGDFDNKANTSLFKGGWKTLIENINILVEKVSLPIDDVSEALQQLAFGNMNVSVKNTYDGKFKQMTENINHTSRTLHLYIDEIAFVLENMANKNFDISIENEYYGDFTKIKDALNLIISNLNKLVKEIYSSSEQVNAGAKQIANTGIDLAKGSSKQTEAVERLNKAVNLVAEQVKKNSENAVTANTLAVDATISVEEGNKEINSMLKAMEEMYEASENISKIIKTIDDIAFQTNILALNAAVEAARAGEHGKGFAVVASEVRSLAGRSQKSAQETANLINTSNEKVQKGMETAEETAKVLKTMSAKIKEITSIISKVSEASEKQNGSIEIIVNDVSQIESVVKNNSTVSEESAAASEQLASQSDLFKEMISGFKFKNM